MQDMPGDETTRLGAQFDRYLDFYGEHVMPKFQTLELKGKA